MYLPLICFEAYATFQPTKWKTNAIIHYFTASDLGIERDNKSCKPVWMSCFAASILQHIAELILWSISKLPSVLLSAVVMSSADSMVAST